MQPQLRSTQVSSTYFQWFHATADVTLHTNPNAITNGYKQASHFSLLCGSNAIVYGVLRGSMNAEVQVNTPVSQSLRIGIGAAVWLRVLNVSGDVLCAIYRVFFSAIQSRIPVERCKLCGQQSITLLFISNSSMSWKRFTALFYGLMIDKLSVRAQAIRIQFFRRNFQTRDQAEHIRCTVDTTRCNLSNLRSSCCFDEFLWHGISVEWLSNETVWRVEFEHLDQP